MSGLKREQKQSDIDNLENILRNIKLISSEDGVKETNKQYLIAIGDLANCIHHHNNEDYVRNKYGALDKSNKIKPHGIFFEGLYYVKIIFEDVDIYSIIVEEDYNEILTHLEQIKEIIEEIIEKTNKFNSKIIDLSKISPKSLTKFSKKYYSSIVLKKIYSTVSMFEIDFAECEDRYTFAQIYINIGELLKEYLFLNFNPVETCVWNGLQNCKNIRDKLVHYEKNIKTGDSDNYEKMTKAIKMVRKYFCEFIINDQTSEKLLIIDFKNGNGNYFNKETKYIYDYLKKTVGKNKSDKAQSSEEIIAKIKDETNYFKTIDENKQLNKEKQIYILKYSFLIISNYLLNLEKLWHEISGTVIIMDILVSYKFFRKFISHELWKPSGNLSKIINVDLVPAISHFEALSDIFKIGSISKTSDVYHQNGLNFTKLCLYEEAICAFSSALSNLNESGNSEEIQQLKYNNISFDQAYAYILYEKYSDAYNIYKPWIENFNDIKSESQAINDNLALILMCSSYCLEKMGKYTDALQICKKAHEISDLYIIKHTLAIIYYRNNEYIESVKIMNELRENTTNNCICRMALEISLAVAILENDDLNYGEKDVRKCIHQMETLFTDNKKEFKEQCEDQYLSYEILIIDMKVSVIIKYNLKDNDVIKKLKDMEDMLENIIFKHENYTKSCQYVTRLYFSFCEANIHLFNTLYLPEYLDNAIDFYRKAMDRLPHDNNISNITIKQSNIKNHFIEIYKTAPNFEIKEKLKEIVDN